MPIRFFISASFAAIFSGCAINAPTFFDSSPHTVENTYKKKQAESAPKDTPPASPGKSVTDKKAMEEVKMRPYEVNGVTYYPTTVDVGEEFTGLASWYGPDFNGKKTASGEDYDMNADTAAHKTFPMGTVLRVTNVQNDKSAVVRVNDRGPFVEGRIIDVSYDAGKKLGLDKTGTAPVKLAVLGFDGTITTLAAKESDKNRSVVIKNFGVQIGAFKNKDSAANTVAANKFVDGIYSASMKEYDINGTMLYRITLSGFKSEQEARDFIKKGLFPGAFVVSTE